MLGFFPTLYPGELLYSAIARYQIRSGNLSPKLTIEELFNSRSVTATADLPCGLDNLVKNLPPHSLITVDSLIQHHTLYPFYCPFLPPKRARQIEISMRGIYGGNIHTRAGIMASAINTPQYFRFCPDCLQETLDKYGETYWHRLHQVPGVLFRHDRKWLNQNSPKLKQPTPSIDRVDWSVRDQEILSQAQSAVSKLRRAKKPVRITIGKVGTTIGLKALLEKHLDKLPHTKAYLDSVTETVEDFQIRRIKWAVEELNLQGEEIKEWKILRVAGLREDLSDQVKMFLEQKLHH